MTVSRVVLLLALASAPLLACDKSGARTEAPGEDQVDARTRELLAALAAGDRERATSGASATLAAALDERVVASLARTLTWLGPIVSLTPAGEAPVEAGIERRYTVGFDRGEVGLTVVVIGDRLEGFRFDEDAWAALADRALEASAGSLRVVELAFVDADGQPIAALTDASEIRYSLAVEGLDAQLREHHLSVDKRVFDDHGAAVYRQREPDDIRFPQAETGSSGGRLTGAVAVPGPGRYELELSIRDLVGGASLVHRVPLEVGGPS